MMVASVVRSSTFSKHFSSATTGLISFKFYMQPSGEGGKKIYLYGLGHMTKAYIIKNLTNLLHNH